VKVIKPVPPVFRGQLLAFKLSIITVVLNDRSGLEQTLRSLRAQSGDFEFIVIDGGSVDGTLDLIRSNSDLITHCVSEPDEGIYDAMNKGIELATGDGLLFLNARDVIVGDLINDISDAPVLLAIRYVDIFGRMRVLKPRSDKLGIPYCHQGIVFPRSNIRYDLKYRLSADYDYYLRHGFRKIARVQSKSSYVAYDNKGVSVSMRSVADRETVAIVRMYFGFSWAAAYEVRRALKSIVYWGIKKWKAAIR
jgi:glycosyltransferase involved in cell wall biosynthesis